MQSESIIKKTFVYFIPAVLLAWNFMALHMAGPFYLSRIDPEYPYLLNGLNCALFDFSRIGHTDHPGTPFQFITGIFILITYVIVGKGNIVEDVIARPEMYLQWSAFLLSILTVVMLIWLGRLLIKNKFDLISVAILQSTIFLNAVLLDMSTRYIPDRMFIVYVLLLAGMCIKFFYHEGYKERKFAFSTGLIMGVAFATKFNFLPVLIIPFLLIRKIQNHIIYILSLFAAAFVSILPIIDKFSNFRIFISGVFKHDGMYGQGSEQIINLTKFFNNLETIVNYNTSFIIILGFAVVVLIVFLFSSKIRKQHRKEFILIIAFLLASMINTVMVAKHFKNYYLTPVLSLSGLTLFVVYIIYTSVNALKKYKAIFILILLVLVIFPAFKIRRSFNEKIQQKEKNLITAKFIQENITKEDFFLIEPTWMSGPMVANGLVYGISYVAHRPLYYSNYAKVYPNVITYEGQGNSFKYFRMKDIEREILLGSGKSIFILDTPGRFAHKIIDELKTLAAIEFLTIKTDTVFQNQNNRESLIKLSATEMIEIDSLGVE